VHEYIVSNGHRERIVRHDLSTDNMTDTCLKFEFMGTQCCHVVKALDFMNNNRLSEKYFLQRWQKNAKMRKTISLLGSEIESEVHIARRYSLLMRTLNGIFSTTSQSEKTYKYALGMAREVLSKVEELAYQESGHSQMNDNQLPRNEASNITSETSK
jgi:zinc finger SWIM domain-containing protein 3